MLILSLLAMASVTIIVLKAVVNNLWHISHKHTNMIITTVLFFLIFILFNGSDKLFATWWKLLLWKYLIPHSSLTFLLILVNSNISGVRLNIMNFINFFQNKLGYFIFFSNILCHAQSLRTPCVCYLSLKQSLVFWKNTMFTANRSGHSNKHIFTGLHKWSFWKIGQLSYLQFFPVKSAIFLW